jgi:ubiquinone/menaquinone biosynthesis C-methylase UbiE
MAKDENLIIRAGGWRPTSAVDRMQYLDELSSTEFFRVYKRQSDEILDIHAGQLVLDVGCGTGSDVRRIGVLTGSDGLAVGVDNDAAMIGTARQRVAGAYPQIQFCVGNAHWLPFDDGTFDRCRADRVLQHLENPRKALTELVRVLTRSGRVLVAEPDWETVVIDAADHTTTRRILNFICDFKIRNGWIGRRLPNLFKECGLRDIGVAASTIPSDSFILSDRVLGLQRNARAAAQAGVISHEDALRWVAVLKQSATKDRFFAAATGFAVYGSKR